MSSSRTSTDSLPKEYQNQPRKTPCPKARHPRLTLTSDPLPYRPETISADSHPEMTRSNPAAAILGVEYDASSRDRDAEAESGERPMRKLRRGSSTTSFAARIRDDWAG